MFVIINMCRVYCDIVLCCINMSSSPSSSNIIRIVLQGGDNMLGRAVGLTLQYQTIGADAITDTQSAQDYLNDILPDVDIGWIRDQNINGEYLWGDLPFDLGENVRIINLE